MCNLSLSAHWRNPLKLALATLPRNIYKNGLLANKQIGTLRIVNYYKIKSCDSVNSCKGFLTHVDQEGCNSGNGKNVVRGWRARA